MQIPIWFLPKDEVLPDREILYRGTLNTSIVRIADVFRGAIRRNCAEIIVAHSHPSGDSSPSPEDVALTRKLVKAGELMTCRCWITWWLGRRGTGVCGRRGWGGEIAQGSVSP